MSQQQDHQKSSRKEQRTILQTKEHQTCNCFSCILDDPSEAATGGVL